MDDHCFLCNKIIADIQAQKLIKFYQTEILGIQYCRGIYSKCTVRLLNFIHLHLQLWDVMTKCTFTKTVEDESFYLNRLSLIGLYRTIHKNRKLFLEQNHFWTSYKWPEWISFCTAFPFVLDWQNWNFWVAQQLDHNGSLVLNIFYFEIPLNRPSGGLAMKSFHSFNLSIYQWHSIPKNRIESLNKKM